MKIYELPKKEQLKLNTRPTHVYSFSHSYQFPLSRWYRIKKKDFACPVHCTCMSSLQPNSDATRSCKNHTERSRNQTWNHFSCFKGNWACFTLSQNHHVTSTAIFYLNKCLWTVHYLLLQIQSYSEICRQLSWHCHYDQQVCGDQRIHFTNLICELLSINNKRAAKGTERGQVCHWGYQVGRCSIEPRMRQLHKALQHAQASKKCDGQIRLY